MSSMQSSHEQIQSDDYENPDYPKFAGHDFSRFWSGRTIGNSVCLPFGHEPRDGGNRQSTFGWHPASKNRSAHDANAGTPVSKITLFTELFADNLFRLL